MGSDRSTLTRRRFVGATAATAVSASAVIGRPAAASVRNRGRGRRPRGNYRIDVHAHHSPQAWIDFIDANGGPAAVGLPPLPPWSIEGHLAFMDRFQIRATVSSIGTPALAFGDPAQRREVAREINEFGAETLIGEHGTRFGVFTVLPMPDLEGSLVELEHAMNVLKLDGVGLLTNYGGRYLGHPDFESLYVKLDELEATVFVHPANAPSVPTPGFPNGPAFGQFVVEFPFDTTRTIVSLVYSGVPKRYPRIRWIFVHAGGTVPFLAFRLATLHAFQPTFNEVLPEGPVPYLERFFYDTAQAFSVAQMKALTEVVALKQILFGSDWPPVSNLFGAQNTELIPWPDDDLPQDGDPAPPLDDVFPRPERLKIDRLNALALFPRLAERVT